jgi:hypothetical protein
MVLTFRYRRRQRRVKAAARAYAAKQVLTFAPSEDAAEAEAEDPIASWVAALADEQARAEAQNGGARRASRRPAGSTSQG